MVSKSVWHFVGKPLNWLTDPEASSGGNKIMIGVYKWELNDWIGVNVETCMNVIIFVWYNFEIRLRNTILRWKWTRQNKKGFTVKAKWGLLSPPLWRHLNASNNGDTLLTIDSSEWSPPPPVADKCRSLVLSDGEQCLSPGGGPQH